MNETALVTGGAGFIGSTIVRAGLARGWHVKVLDNFSTGYRENLADHDRLTVIDGDVTDPDAVTQALADVTVVFHLAATVGNVRSLEDPMGDARTNVLGTRCLLASMRDRGVGRLVYSSSAAIFGEPVSVPLTESHPTDPASPYGVSKLAAEKDCLCFGRTYGWTVSALRYFNVYGVNQRYDEYGNVIPIFTRRIAEKKPLTIYGDGKQTRDFIHVEDVAEANCLAAERRAVGSFNIGTGVGTTVIDVARCLERIAGREEQIEYVEPRAGEVRHSIAAIDRAAHELGFVPRKSLAQGLAEYVPWFLTGWVNAGSDEA